MENPMKNEKKVFPACYEQEKELLMTKFRMFQSSQPKITETKNLGPDGIVNYYEPSNWFLEGMQKFFFEMRLRAVHLSPSADHSGVVSLNEEEGIYRMLMEQRLYDFVVVYSITENVIDVHFGDYYPIYREVVGKKLEKIQQEFPNVMDTRETLQYVIENRCSLARFGDGEFNLCRGNAIGFQTHSKRLEFKLQTVLRTRSTKKLLVAIPDFNPEKNNIQNIIGNLSFWEHYWFKTFDFLKPMLTQKFYGNANVSRNSIFYENSLEDIRKLWEGRDVVFIFGLGGRFLIKPELFDNINSSSIIGCSPTNAFDEYDTLMEECLKMPKDRLFLASCGPCATVLAYDLSNKGYQCIDIGHLPNCYDQYLGNIESPDRLPYVSYPTQIN